MAAESAVVLWRKLVTARPFFLMTGPNVLQGRDHALRLAERIARVRDARGLQVVFKSSFDKANRTSLGSFRGPGMAEVQDPSKLGVGKALKALIDADSVAEPEVVGSCS